MFSLFIEVIDLQRVSLMRIIYGYKENKVIFSKKIRLFFQIPFLC